MKGKCHREQYREIKWRTSYLLLRHSSWHSIHFCVLASYWIQHISISFLYRYFAFTFKPFIGYFYCNIVSINCKRRTWKQKNIKLPFYGFVSLVLIIYIFFIQEFIKSVSLFRELGFFFLNEKSILYFCCLFIFISVALTIRSFFNRTDILAQVLAVALAHIALSMSAGYSDGKTIFNGAANVHFLEQKELCENGGVRDWVYLEKFGENAFFLNTIEKRICILNEIKFNLFSRKYKEGLE